MTPVAERPRRRAKSSYGVEALLELLIGALFTWGVFAHESISPGWRVVRAGIAILCLLAAIQSFSGWRHPEMERTLSDSLRRVLEALRVTARIIAAILAVVGAVLRFLVATPAARDWATDLLILFSVFLFADYCLGRDIRD